VGKLVRVFRRHNHVILVPVTEIAHFQTGVHGVLVRRPVTVVR